MIPVACAGNYLFVPPTGFMPAAAVAGCNVAFASHVFGRESGQIRRAAASRACRRVRRAAQPARAGESVNIYLRGPVWAASLAGCVCW